MAKDVDKKQEDKKGITSSKKISKRKNDSKRQNTRRFESTFFCEFCCKKIEGKDHLETHMKACSQRGNDKKFCKYHSKDSDQTQAHELFNGKCKE